MTASSDARRSAEKDDAGLEGRYRVEKINDPTGKHDDCRYFVLDPQHDRIARAALRAYARGARASGHFALADDLDLWLHRLARTERQSAEKDAWIDRHGDVWTLGHDGLMHTPETRPFPREYVEKKWGPLRRVFPPGIGDIDA